MAIKDNRGKAGAKALKKDKEEKINKNIKKLKKYISIILCRF